ncbi:DUF6572 domain-containing protein [Labrys wisconsinensis]|uniref:Uncharacterized protein n=1 Tax=Labrys wisconsinensis TaxID=425677 RepID=A0ABU0J3R7_9HYPH|nr:DUF6572 domain-containing protein [Labrys wisconsinensis]MDQ0468255.1 hypothetical protein [Labrys wisconsinensis]
MSLSDFTSIDLITRLPGVSSRVGLVIYDNGDIADDAERESALRRKLSAYLLFVVSGQFAKAYPSVADCELSAEVVCATPPTEAMKQMEAVHAPGIPDFVLPVNVTEDAAFRARFGLSDRRPLPR